MARLGLRLREERVPVPRLTELARLAEAAGYDSVWVPEGSGRDAFSQLVAHALATSRIALGTGIVTIYPRSAPILAMTVATLDQVSNGRAILGLGIGHRELLVSGHGVPFDRPVGRMRDYVAGIRAILGRDATPDGSFRLDFTPARSSVPIWIAALGPQMCALAGEVADGVLLNWATPEAVAEAIDHVRRGAERGGRKPEAVEIACYIRVAVGEPSAVRHALALETARYVSLDFYRRMFDRSGFAEDTAAVMRAWPRGVDAAAAEVSDRMLEAVTVSGTPEACRARFDAYRALGVGLPVIAPVPAGPDPFDSWVAAIQAFAPGAR
jgi:alkanesulfonate monooxygenase SsuD/methylene tetrahydromethanopterin reductase-like flavin-dependent oxidoreductase (luciferase family)